MDVNYEFVPEFKSTELKAKSDIISYAGKLLEIVDSPTVIVSLRPDGRPFILSCSDCLVDALDFHLETY